MNREKAFDVSYRKRHVKKANIKIREIVINLQDRTPVEMSFVSDFMDFGVPDNYPVTYGSSDL